VTPEQLAAATDGLATPALVVDLETADRNLALAAGIASAGGLALRPHFKAHKCTRLLERQLAAGACSGVTCATAAEALVLAAAGIDAILVANEVADPAGLNALARAAALADVTVCVDDPRHLELLAGTGARLGVLIEIDIGQQRCGLSPGAPALLDLARMVTAAPALELRGLQGYEGHAVLRPADAERAAAVATAGEILRAERDRLLAAGLPCPVLSGGGTGTLALAAEERTLTEVQAGSYVLMDATYGALGLPFAQALFCRATVVSRHGGRVVLDAGLKALSAEYGMPVAAAGGLTVTSLADEHATAVAAGPAPGVGDAVLLVPAHVDPTVNLHPALHVVRADGAVDAWPVDGRR